MKHVFNRNVLILGLGLCLGVLLALGSNVMSKSGGEDAATASLPLEDIRTLSEVFGKIKEHYVEDVTDKQLLENAIRGMLSGLDPHSSYLDKEGYQDLRVSTTGEFGGLGIVVGMEEGFVKVISPIDDTPAAKAGIKAGDIIIRLDDKPVKGMSLDDAVKMMRGAPGTKIELTVLREKTEKPQKFTLTREKIHVKSVKQRTLDEGFGYVRISQFQDRTGEELRKAISKLKEENKGGLKGLVLDLRNNPGGLLEQAVEVSDAFITKGKIVSIKGRGGSNTSTRNATPNDYLNGAPIVVLVNGGSASASEIVAGALQDHKRAVLMGSRTFGKGSVQTVVPISNDTAIKLTTARYYTPSDRSIQAEGIEPDIALDNLKLAENKGDTGLAPVKEADLEGHLENGAAKGSDKTKVEDAKKKRLSLVTEDYPVYEALNLLKGMALLSSAKTK